MESTRTERLDADQQFPVFSLPGSYSYMPVCEFDPAVIQQQQHWWQMDDCVGLFRRLVSVTAAVAGWHELC